MAGTVELKRGQPMVFVGTKTPKTPTKFKKSDEHHEA